jgi:hypothetical protein
MGSSALSVRDMARYDQLVRWASTRVGWRISDLPRELGIRTEAGLRPYLRAACLAGRRVWDVDGTYTIGGWDA